MFKRTATPWIVGCTLLFAQAAISGCERLGDAASLDLPTGIVEQEIRIGSIDDPGYSFGPVRTLAVARDGNIYSLHRQEALIRRWSSLGKALGTIGGEGEGPGEFMAPLTMGWRGDSLWVFDSSRSSRISFFDRSGNYLGALSPSVDIGSVQQGAQGIFPPRPRGLLGDGTIYGVTPAFSNDIVTGKLTRIDHVRMRLDGSTIDTIATIPTGKADVLGILREGGGTYMSQPFSDGVLSTPTADGRAFLILERSASQGGDEGEFRLHRVALDGDTVFSRSYPFEPIALTSDTVDARVNGMAEDLVEFGGQIGLGDKTVAQWASSVREAMYTPEHYPPVSELVAGRDGTIWLARSPATSTTTRWLVLDGDGNPIATVEVPGGLDLMVAERSMIWGIEQDDLEVDYIVRYRVELPEGD